MITEILFLVVIFVAWLQYYTQQRPPNFPPGPIGIPGLGYLPFLKLPLHKGLSELVKKHGKVYSIFMANFPSVIVHDWKILRDAFKDERFSGRPPFKLFSDRSFGKQRGIVFSTDRSWMEQRRFTIKNLRDFGFGKGSMEELIKDEVVDLISEFKKQLNRPVKIEMQFNMAVLNSLWHIISGERYSHDDPRLSHLLKILSEEFEKVQVQGPMFLMPWLTNIFPEQTGLNTFMKTLDLTYAFLKESVTAHKKNFDPNNPRDLIDVYLKEIQNTTDPKSSFYKEEGETEMLVVLLDLFGAGADTSSTSLCWTILYLITYPEIQKKVQKELDTVVGASRLPSLTDRPRMPYLEAVIAETLRMSSIAPLIMRSTTETVDFHGYTLPKDTLVFGNLYHFHHDEEHWGDPENFRPERFIDTEGKFKKDEMLNPFSTGKRLCPGESLARDSMFLFLSGLLQQFRFEIDPNSPSPTLKAKDGLITKTHPYNVIMKDRKSLKSEE